MTSSRYNMDKIVSTAGEDSDEDEEIFSVSGRQRGPIVRGAQSSGFGALDDDGIELQLDSGQEDDFRQQVSSRDKQLNREEPVSMPSYQTGTAGTNSSSRGDSQQRADEIEEMVDKLLTIIGFGKFHVLLLFMCGCGLFFASAQLEFVGILLPDIARDLCLSDSSTGWLRGSVFVGVVFASVLWGCAADLGSRRTSLAVCLGITCLSTVMAASLAQSRTALLAFLIITSLGTGGLISTPFSYAMEFLPRRMAQKTTCALLIFTVLGAMFVPLVTPAFTSSVAERVSSGDFSPSSFANWRIFCLVLSVLLVASAMLLAAAILPRSPYLLLEKRLWAKAIQALGKVYTFNHGEAGLEMFKDRASGLYRLKRHSRDRQEHAPSTTLQSCMRPLYQCAKNVTAILDKTTFVMTTGAFCFAFGNCAWTLWMSDFIIADGLSYNASIIRNATFSHETFTESLERQTFINTTFDSVSFRDIYLRDLSYTGCTFTACVFEGVVSEATLFTHCRFLDTRFGKTDFQPRQFVGGTEPVNSSLAPPPGAGVAGGVRNRGCSVDVPFAPALAYWRILFGQCGGLLGLLLSVFITRVIEQWRLFMCGALVTAVTILFGFFPLTGWTAAAHLFALQFGGFTAWSALTVQATMSFPTHKRATGLGLLVSVVTTGGLLGFLTVVALPRIADVILTALAVLASAMCSYFFQRHPQNWRENS
ncbi:synaptic vesicle glycoprotein 2C-like [Acanthaster planci]|uniref:Synaptic vesicle glycoprotein 2C-like n=1 Tax=Acanthaster planci TaxID=133434 RepID=A0A8B7XYU5_ACAPL|nr:synaptic vesicle glycoprotein 2C-like [Acanthaster planci]